MPGAFKPQCGDARGRCADRGRLIRHVAHLVSCRAHTGRTIALALEPEPCCLLETVDETVAFFGSHLYSKRAATTLASLAGFEREPSSAARHLGVCLDVCHAAVEFEDPADCFGAARGAGIPIAKMQVTAGCASRG